MKKLFVILFSLPFIMYGQNNTNTNLKAISCAVYSLINSENLTSHTPKELVPEILEFSVFQKDNHIEIKWVILNETQNSHFNVEKSTDGVKWEKLPQVNSKESTNGITSYQIKDENPYKSTSYYRMRLFDEKGKFYYTPVREVSLEQSLESVKVSPESVEDVILINWNETSFKKLKITLIDARGQEIPVEVTQHNSSASIKVDQIEKGNYFLRLSTAKQKRMVKVSVQ